MEIIQGYIPGAIAGITGLHARYYSKYWGFGLFFEVKVAKDLAEFLTRFEPTRDGLWLLTDKEEIMGSIAIDGLHHKEEGAHLRWFIVSKHLWGRGYGKELLKRAMDFCDQKCYRKVFLWTFEGLDRARRLYEHFGFRLEREVVGTQWGVEVREQYMVRLIYF